MGMKLCRLRARFWQCLLVAVSLLLVAKAQALVVLQYHHVSASTPASTSVTPAVFARHMALLEEHEFAVMDMPAFLKALHSGEPLPDKTALITFDDGYQSIYDTAWPILKKYNWPFTVFINTDNHNDRGDKLHMNWGQLQALAKSGVTIGNHSASHSHLVRREPGESTEQYLARMEQELLGAQKVITERLGRQPKVFAYPFGEFTPELTALLREHGFVGFGQQSGPVALWNDPAALPRFPFGGHYGDEKDFITKLMTVPFPLQRLEVTVEGKPLNTPILPRAATVPRMRLFAEDERLLKRTSCFASGQGQVQTQWQGDHLAVTANQPFGPGRSRYNCTASAGDGRFYWLSDTFINRHKDGSWYEE